MQRESMMIVMIKMSIEELESRRVALEKEMESMSTDDRRFWTLATQVNELSRTIVNKAKLELEGK